MFNILIIFIVIFLLRSLIFQSDWNQKNVIDMNILTAYYNQQIKEYIINISFNMEILG